MTASETEWLTKTFEPTAGVAFVNGYRVGSPKRLRQETFGKSVRISFSDEPRRWLNAVQDLAFVQHVDVERGSLVITLDEPEQQNPVLLRTLISKGAQVCYVEPVNASLEDVYLKLVAGPQLRRTLPR